MLGLAPRRTRAFLPEAFSDQAQRPPAQLLALRPDTLLALVKLQAVAGSDRMVEPVQPVVREMEAESILPPPRSTPLIRQE